MSVIHHLVYMVQPVKIMSMDTLVNVNKDGKVCIVSWMSMSAYPTPASMASVFRETPVSVIPVSASQGLWDEAVSLITMIALYSPAPLGFFALME
ncbi:hypothetical protein LUU34_00369300 [Aix galericulata]|nr:hypothetical protein LUU34_00369300 [Aix galericulata]